MENNIPTRKLIARILVRFFWVMLILLICFLFGDTLLSYFLPFILAYFVASAVLMPVIKKLSGKFEHFRRFWAIVLVIAIMAIVLLIVFGIIYYLISQVSDMVKNWEFYKDTLRELASNVARLISSATNLNYDSVLNNINQLGDKVISWCTKELPGLAPTVVDSIGDYVPTVGNFFLAFLIFLMATYFICADYPIVKKGLHSVVPEGFKPQFEQIKNAAGSATFGYLKAQLIISGLVALIAYVVLLIVGQSYAILFALIIGIVDFIPLLGSSVVLIPWIIMLAFAGDFPKMIVLAILCVGLFLFRRIVEPRIVGDQTGLHPLVSLISLYIGIKIGGLLGMIAAPIVCMICVGLYRVGFFKPTVNDLKLLMSRIAEYAEMK